MLPWWGFFQIHRGPSVFHMSARELFFSTEAVGTASVRQGVLSVPQKVLVPQKTCKGFEHSPFNLDVVYYTKVL